MLPFVKFEILFIVTSVSKRKYLAKPWKEIFDPSGSNISQVNR